MPRTWPEHFCCDGDLALIGYDGRRAAEELERWRREGPRPETQELIDVVTGAGVEGATVLDVGAGVGVVHTALLEAGAGRAIDVDASREYLAAAQSEAERRGMADRIEYRFGDLVELAAELPRADVVTLDSVICCYPYLERLVQAAVALGPRVVGFSYPRDVWWMVLFMRLYNGLSALRRTRDRYFIHRHRTLARLMAAGGYVEVHDGGSRPWRVVVYQPAPASGIQPRPSRQPHAPACTESSLGTGRFRGLVNICSMG